MTNTHLNDLFDQMDNEKGNELDDKIKIDRSANVNEMIETLENIFLHILTAGVTTKIPTKYIQSINPKKYSSKDILEFSMALTDEMISNSLGSNIGIYINHLIQESPDQKHEIYTSHLDTEIDYIGLNNQKIIKVQGSLGILAGYRQKKGSIEITEDVDKYLGCEMKGGSILVKGNAGFYAGESMQKGKIEIKGDADEELGLQMTGGSIILHGNPNSFYKTEINGGVIELNGEIGRLPRSSKMKGKIYHKGKLVMGESTSLYQKLRVEINHYKRIIK